MKVKATKAGFIYGKLRSIGEIFTLVSVAGHTPESQFSHKWMVSINEPVEDVQAEKPKTRKPRVSKPKATKSK